MIDDGLKEQPVYDDQTVRVGNLPRYVCSWMSTALIPVERCVEPKPSGIVHGTPSSARLPEENLVFDLYPVNDVAQGMMETLVIQGLEHGGTIKIEIEPMEVAGNMHVVAML
jgi:hypothetical protein